jgi:hypothetical protein
LKRQSDSGHLRKLSRGLYDYPRRHPRLGLLAPSPDALAKALSGRDEVRLQPSGAYAANLLGLSEQVPARVVFLTDGPSRVVRIGKLTIELRRTTPRNVAAAGQLAGLVIQALRHLGPTHINASRVAHLKKTIPSAERKLLVKDLKLAPLWMHGILRDIAEEKKL